MWVPWALRWSQIVPVRDHPLDVHDDLIIHFRYSTTNTLSYFTFIMHMGPPILSWTYSYCVSPTWTLMRRTWVCEICIFCAFVLIQLLSSPDFLWISRSAVCNLLTSIIVLAFSYSICCLLLDIHAGIGLILKRVGLSPMNSSSGYSHVLLFVRLPRLFKGAWLVMVCIHLITDGPRLGESSILMTMLLLPVILLYTSFRPYRWPIGNRRLSGCHMMIYAGFLW